VPALALLLLGGCVEITTPPGSATAYFGEWSGPNMTLTVSPRNILYRKRGGAFDSAYVHTTFRGLAGNDIVYGRRGQNILRVDVPPRRVKGVWTMTVEGTELHRR